MENKGQTNYIPVSASKRRPELQLCTHTRLTYSSFSMLSKHIIAVARGRGLLHARHSGAAARGVFKAW